MTLPFMNAEPAPGLTRPVAQVSFAGAGGGGLGGLVDSLGGGGEDPWTTHLLAVQVRRVFAPDVDVAVITMAAGGPAVAVGDEGSIALGHDDSRETVFSGAVQRVRHGQQGTVRIQVGNGSVLLGRQRLQRSYQEQNADDIVNDLCDAAGISADTSIDGESMPGFISPEHSSSWQVAADLALENGALLSINADGDVVSSSIAAPPGSSMQLTYGDNLVRFDLVDGTPGIDSFRVTGAGASGDQGSDAWNWLRKDVSAMQAVSGAGASGRTLVRGALRSAANVAVAADSHLALRQARARISTLTCIGSPLIAPGDVISIGGTAMDGDYRVFQVDHLFHIEQGYTSTLKIAPAGSTDAPGGLF